MTELARGRDVLVVDDDVDVREALAEILGDLDYNPVLVTNGEDALHYLRTTATRPCLILLDIMMPHMDGREFRAAQRGDPKLAAIPVVILSAHANVGETATELGVSHFVRKPFELEELIAAIDEVAVCA
jgi:CheY-like chemotaxis protein